ncbi:hypothetical protein ABFS83_14G218200 [Erythranthe nasuta]
MANLAAALVIYCTISLSISTCYSITQCPEIEQQSLLRFKESLEDPSNILSSWNLSAHVNCCNWKGVVCDKITGHVHQLRIHSDYKFPGLGGKINPSLLNLNHLKYLDLSQNDFQGTTIPSFIGSLTSLEYLDLSYAGFRGTIPNTIGNLSNLHTLILEGDYYESRLEWLSGLSQLERLHMNYVNLSKAGNWLQVINTLPSLLELNFGYCNLDFVSPLDDVNNNNTSLAILDFSGNNFIQRNSAIEKWIFELSSLVFLDLSDNYFDGRFPNISNATKLRHIELSNNHFNSTIPDWLYSLKDLEFVSMRESYLQGPLSNGIANLTSLNTLDLYSNQLSGEIPREIARLCKLQTLELSNNFFQGDISNSFGNMSDCFLRVLESLALSGNQLSGHLTDQFGEFKSLKTLSLSRNSLSGAIPINIGEVLFLQLLELDANKLAGNLPESLGQLSNLEYLNIEYNKLEGVVSEIHFANLTKLKELSASGNYLTLKVSPNWIPSFKLETLELQSWNLGEANRIPSWVDTQKQIIQKLDLSSTGISGNVPSWFWKIQFLNLSNNQLHGNIPVLSDGNGFRFLYLRSNQFSGSLPQIPANMLELDLSNNSFSGGLSHFLCEMITTDEPYGTLILNLGGNQLTGEIPDCLRKWSSLLYLNLGNNFLSGAIPISIGSLTELRLVKIDLADNELDGSIPSWMGMSISNLKFLILRSNKLSGEISSYMCHLNTLQILDLSDNRLSGIMPRCVDNFTAMATKRNLPEIDGSISIGFFRDSALVATKGSEFYYDIILPLVTNIDLSRNNFSGDIPKELTSLVELRSLNLSGNHFTGMIPQSIGEMKQLESLDLSTNYLSGEMPNGFTVMSTLNYLNVSYNKLTGRIPESTQLRGFDNSSFIGNDLCGPPLTSNCSGGPNMNREGDNH